MITTEKTSNGFAVKFPFELKDNFKSVFKSAKWNPETRAWIVGVRSEAKLKQWIEAVSPAAQDIEEAEAEALTAREVSALETQIANIRADIARERKAKLIYGNVAVALAAAKENLAKATAALALEKLEKTAKAAKANELLGQVCDLDAIQEARRTLIQNHGKVGSKHREAFNDACSAIKEQQNKLNAIGFQSTGLATLYQCNFNRPDRDNPRAVSDSDIFDLVKITDQ